MAKLVSKTYGEALFDLALEDGTLTTIIEEVNVVKEAMKKNPDLLKLLSHPKIKKEEKISVIENIFKGRVSDSLVGFLVIVVQKDRYDDLDGIFEYFVAKVREYKNIGVASITSAVELAEEQKKHIEQRLLQTTKYSQFELTFHVDKSLIGGLVIRIGDRVVDSSIKTKLQMLAKDLRNATV
ncbi:F-type H+-transporting ATPase subunit delta [Anaerosporobacter mobilis DSM 15930]|uniref:ATP synthase subunit delta n=1 Tax=Anaerosporobacter mobilis DSM 15930 TaxID=1120996 RepID=A0A1M7IZA0_9FIRM|nr:ATP synthase F1 subunit delta [Anaerosporobacter mobilis]SHM46164.1 F-type H+-transporting ATPase subunit delta [Anaerosporobacter mobilis DSM 15930]